MVPTIPSALIDLLDRSAHTVVLTGSGISAESGIPTFRDAQTGLWANHRPEDLATPEAFTRDPELVWNWYAWRRELVAEAKPNAGHRAIAELTALAMKLTLITQNVDGLHQRAGSDDIIEFHGNIMRIRCIDGHPAAAIPRSDALPPRCFQCGAMLRPDVVWFGESIPESALESALDATKSCDLFFAIGTSAQVQPAASLATLAKQKGATLIEINPAQTPLSEIADFTLTGPSGEILPALVQALDRVHGHA